MVPARGSGHHPLLDAKIKGGDGEICGIAGGRKQRQKPRRSPGSRRGRRRASVSRRRLTSSARSNVGSAAKGGSALQEAHPEGNTATVMMVMTMTTTTRTTMMLTVVMTMMTMMTMAMMMRMRRVDSCAQSRSTSVDVLVMMSW